MWEWFCALMNNWIWEKKSVLSAISFIFLAFNVSFQVKKYINSHVVSHIVYRSWPHKASLRYQILICGSKTIMQTWFLYGKSGKSVPNRQNMVPLHLMKWRYRALKFLVHFSSFLLTKVPQKRHKSNAKWAYWSSKLSRSTSRSILGVFFKHF